jgi:SAM-dependent methyltransferase
MPFRSSFECLWCGRAWETRSPDDVEGWAQLCPDCVGRAGENGFLRFRLKTALTERTEAQAARAPVGAAVGVAPSEAQRSPGSLDPEMVAYYEARAAEYDDWYLRRGRYDHGTLDNVAWATDLDAATMWLDRLPWHGRIVELAAGTGWWSPLLASKGELWAFDAAEAPLDRARERLVAHKLRAHLHVRDAWSEPTGADLPAPAAGLFTGFWLTHVERGRLPAFLEIVRSWLAPGGLFAFIDSRPDAASGATDHHPAEGDRSRRRLADGREFTIPKVHYEPAELAEALAAAGLSEIDVGATNRFFLLGQARR